ncbi:hypothetical protein [Blastococcus sp. SYSU DS1021]
MGDSQAGDHLDAAAAATTGVIAQLALGAGPLGVVAGGFAPVLASAVHRRWRAKANEALAVAADILDTGLDILDERKPGYDERLELTARVIEAAARATIPAKIQALGQVLADGLGDEGATGEALVLASALAVLEGPHVVVLEYVHASPVPPEHMLDTETKAIVGWQADHLAQALPALRDVVDGLVAVLGGQGLLRDASGTNYASLAGAPVWQITSLGERCLFLLGLST